ncbi:MAG: aminotransferase class V-fold PLP-dependent enzyme [Sporichthyaceae bacterium]|nr:aminotransferase class V-fold PLP-dependent enzyme [Sporichthyaceae bacterium]
MATDPSTAAAPPEGNPIWGEDWFEVRALWPLEPTVAHLNHGSYGAVPTPVLEEQQSWRDRMESNPVRFFTRELPAALDQARAEVATFLASDLDGIAFVTNATTAVSTVLSAFPLTPSDSVLVTDHTYGAVRIAAARWTSRARGRLDTVHVPLTVDEAGAVDAVLAAVRPDTRLAVLDQVTSPTARRLPLVDLVPALQDRGVAVLVDGAHAPGMLAVDLDRLGADFWTGNLHKWACAPRGAAVLQVHARWRSEVLPLVASWGEDAGFPASFADTGTADVTAWLSAPRALRLLEHLGLDRLRRHNVELAVAGQRVVADALRVPRDDLPRDPAVSMQLVPLPDELITDDAAAAALQARIGREAAVEVAVTTWAGRGFLRLSAQAYNALPDYRRLAADLPALL